MMECIINSNQNRIIKHVKSLQIRKNREELREFIVEGIKISYEAFNHNAIIQFAIFDESYKENQELYSLMSDLKAHNIKIYIVNAKLFNDISETDAPQGVILVIKKIDHVNLLNYKKEEMNIVILDGIKDPGNLGTIIRTADAFKVDAVLLSKGCVDLYNGKTIRSTMGSIFHIPLIDNLQLDEFLLELKSDGFKIIGADPHASLSIGDLKNHMKTAIVMGSESHGISEEVISHLDETFKIPMPGKAESLNASVAAALSMYEIFVKK